jgi:hypothetical protein
MRSHQFLRLILLGFVAIASAHHAFAQGSLTPPGAPAPTMKTLDQLYSKMDARTAITSIGAATISAPGSYYLTTNITVSSGNGVNITVPNVTLDLNGFTISSTSATPSGSGVAIQSGATDVTVLNGHIKGTFVNAGGNFSGGGFFSGINGSSQNVRVTGVSVTACTNYGISLLTSQSTIIESCAVQGIGGTGLYAANVSHSTAYQCSGTAILADTVSDCFAQSLSNNVAINATTANNCSATCTGNGSGIQASMVNNCYGVANGNGTGIFCTTANNCHGSSTGGVGIAATTAISCHGFSTSNDGISTSIAKACYGISNGSGRGIYASQTASDCYGSSATGIGIQATIATACVGSRPGGTAISTTIGNGCFSTAGTNIVSYKYNMP